MNLTLLYVSELAATAPIDSVAKIARTARSRNGRAGITGLLLFDGATFAQMVQGPAASIAELLERLRADSRHFDLEILSMADQVGPCRFPDWQLGFVMIDSEEDALSRLRGVAAEESLLAFDAILPELGVGAGEAVPA